MCAPLVYASPDPGWYKSRPQSVYVFGISVTDMGKAIDGENTTCAYFDRNADGYFEVYNYTGEVPPRGSRIERVDLKIMFEAEAGMDDAYRIVYYVRDETLPYTSDNVEVLFDWRAGGTPLNTYVNESVREPNDGTWNWTDVNNIRYRIETDRETGPEGKKVYVYEIWATIYYVLPKLYVEPQSILNLEVDTTFGVDVNVTDVDELYGWEIKLSYDGSILNGTSVTEGPFLSAVAGTEGTYFKVLNFSDDIKGDGTYEGLVWVTCTILGDYPGAAGSGDLVTIGFKVKGAGETNLDLHDTKLAGYNFKEKMIYRITHEAFDGYVSSVVVPEFPLGAAAEIALITVVVYIWWRRRKISGNTCPAKVL